MFGQKLKKFFVRRTGRQVETVWFISHPCKHLNQCVFILKDTQKLHLVKVI